MVVMKAFQNLDTGHKFLQNLKVIRVSSARSTRRESQAREAVIHGKLSPASGRKS
jgi:hypothetical protein